MATFGVVVQIGHWRAVVHRVTCPWYRRAAHKSVPVPPGAAVVLCGTCEPTEAEVRSDPPFVEFYEYGIPRGAPKAEPQRVGYDYALDHHARQSLGYGRTPARYPQYEPDG